MESAMGLFTKPIKNLDDLFVHMLQDMYYAEQQAAKNLPMLIEKAQSTALKQAFQKHFSETDGQIKRLEQVFKLHGQAAKGVTCAAMDGIINRDEGDHFGLRRPRGLRCGDDCGGAGGRALRDHAVWNHGRLCRGIGPG